MFLKNKNTPEVGQDRDLRKKNKTCLTMTFNKDVVIKILLQELTKDQLHGIGSSEQSQDIYKCAYNTVEYVGTL